MGQFIKKIFYYTYRTAYPRFGKNPIYAYFDISLSTWGNISFIVANINKRIFHATTGDITIITIFLISFSYNYFVILYKEKYRDIILSNKATPLQCVLYAILYNFVLPLFISYILVFI